MTFPKLALPARSRLSLRVLSVPAARLAGAVAFAGILAIAIISALPLFRAADLVTGSGDWHAHAYRIHDLRSHGLSTWTHDWAGGLPLWSAYQFAPHLVTWAGIALTGASETRAMAVAQAVLLVWLPVSMFLVMRWSGLRISSATLAAILTIALDSRRQAVANFSELWGLAIVPIVLWMVFRTSGRRSGYATALLCGAVVYVHPLAGVVGVLGMVAAAIVRREARPYAHRMWKVSITLIAPGLQCAIAIAVAAFFWVPAVSSARPAYEHPYFTSAPFERMLARLATASFLPGWPLWLASAAFVLLGCSIWGSAARRQAARYLLLMSVLITAPALAALAGWGPRFFLDAQLPRLLSLLPLLTAAALALACDAVLSRPLAGPSRMGRYRPNAPLIRAGGALVIGGLAVLVLTRDADLSDVARRGSAAPSTSFARWLATQPPGTSPGARVFAVPELVPEASYFVYGHAWYTGSYSGQEWSILGGPLRMLMDGPGEPETRAAYLTAMAVDLAVVSSGHRPAIADPRTGAPAEWIEVARLGDVDVLRLPWQAPLAFAVPRQAVAALDAPNLPYSSVDDSYIRDVHVRRYADLALGPEVTPSRVRAPAPDALELTVPRPMRASTLIVGENWDTAWRASAGDRSLSVHRAGPNLLAVDLSPVSSGEDGMVTVRLTHGTPHAWRLGALLAFLSLPAAIAAMRWGPRVERSGMAAEPTPDT